MLTSSYLYVSGLGFRLASRDSQNGAGRESIEMARVQRKWRGSSENGAVTSSEARVKSSEGRVTSSEINRLAPSLSFIVISIHYSVHYMT